MSPHQLDPRNNSPVNNGEVMVFFLTLTLSTETFSCHPLSLALFPIRITIRQNSILWQSPYVSR